MKITADRQALTAALTWVCAAVPKRPQFPALAGVKVTAEVDRLALEGFDFDVAHTAYVAAEVSDPGSVLVPASLLRDVLGVMPGARLELILDGGSLTVRSSAGRPSFTVRTLLIEDYPTLPDVPKPLGTLDAGALRWVVETVLHPIDDGIEPASLTGVRLEAADGELTAVGTCRTRMAASTLAWDGEPFTATVPARALAAAVKGMSGRVSVGHREGIVSLSDDARSVTLRLLDGEYPDWRRLFAQGAQNTVSVTCDPAALAEALGSAVVMGDRRAPIAELAFESDGIGVSAAEESGAAEDWVDATLEGDPCAATVNPRFLADALGVVADAEVTLHVTAGEGPAKFLITPAEQRTQALVMGRKRTV